MWLRLSSVSTYYISLQYPMFFECNSAAKYRENFHLFVTISQTQTSLLVHQEFQQKESTYWNIHGQLRAAWIGYLSYLMFLSAEGRPRSTRLYLLKAFGPCCTGTLWDMIDLQMQLSEFIHSRSKLIYTRICVLAQIWFDQSMLCCQWTNPA